MTGEITILYGSETGNAEEYAKYLKQRLRSYNLKPINLASLDDYPLKRLVTHFVFNYNMFYNRTRRNP